MNVTFREAHKKVGSIFKVIDLENIENGIEKIVDSLGIKEKSVDFNELLMKRKSLGSPNLNEIDRLIKSREIMINTYKEILNDKMNKILKAMEEIKKIQHTQLKRSRVEASYLKMNLKKKFMSNPVSKML